jgi:hypothetical protein
MRVHAFTAEVWLPLLLDEVFSFFADAGNLERITPPWLRFRIVTPQPIEMKVGTIIDYELRVHGLPLRWRALIKEWKPPERFVDDQVRGPYRQWIHEHTFEPRDGGALARDLVRYAVPLDFIAHPLFVRRDIERIFSFRRETLRAIFARKV